MGDCRVRIRGTIPVLMYTLIVLLQTRSQAAARLREERAKQRAADLPLLEGMDGCDGVEEGGHVCEASPMDMRRDSDGGCACCPGEQGNSQGMERSGCLEEHYQASRHESMRMDEDEDSRHSSPPATPVHQIVRHDPNERWEPPRAPKKSRLRRIDPEEFAFGMQLSRRLDFEKNIHREEG